MNKILIYFVGILILISSCAPGYTDIYADGEIELTTQDIKLKQFKTGVTINISGSRKWKIDTTETASWCSVIGVRNHGTINNLKDYITVMAQENRGIYSRETKFRVYSNESSKEIRVLQIGNESTILTNKGDTILVGNDKTVVDLSLITNINFDMGTSSDWLEIITGYVNDETPIRIGVEANSANRDRIDSIVFKHKESDFVKNIYFVQKGSSLDYEQSDVSHIDGNHKLKVTSASASSTAKGKEIEKSYDNNDITFFQSDWQPMLPVLKPVELIYNFTNEKSMHYFLYTPNKLDTKKIFANTEIWVQCKGDSDYRLVKNHTFSGDFTQKVEFDSRIENPVSIKFVVKTVNDVSEQEYLSAACAEMRFYSTDLQYDDIFTDKSYSSLKVGVTIDDVFKIDDEFFRNIAEYLFYQKYPAIRIQEYKPFPTPGVVHAMKAHGLLENPTGISVKKGEDLIVMVNDLNRQTVKVTLLDANGDFVKTDYTIDEGVSKFKMTADGTLYITHFATTPVTIHVAGGVVNGYYDSQKNSDSEGFAYLNKATGGYFDLLGKYVHLILPTEALKANTTSLKALVDRYDEIVSLHYKFNGAEKSGSYPKNRICIKSTSAPTLVSKPNVVLLSEKEIQNYTTVDLIKKDVLWTLSSAVADATNISFFRAWLPSSKDLFPAYVQWKLEGITKLKYDGIYTAAYLKFFVNGEKYTNTIASDFARVIPLWQIYLYMSEVCGKEDFNADLDISLLKSSGVELYFVQKCNSVAGIDFNTFFKDWCLTSTGGVVATKAPLTLKYLCESTIELFKNPLPLDVKDTWTFATVNEGSEGTVRKKTTITIRPQVKNAVAYEIQSWNRVVHVFNERSHVIYDFDQTSMSVYAIGIDGTRTKIDYKK